MNRFQIPFLIETGIRRSLRDRILGMFRKRLKKPILPKKAIASLGLVFLFLFCLPHGSQATSGFILSPSTNLEDIIEDYRARNYSSAILQLFYYIERTPVPKDRPKAEFLMGLALLKSGKPKEAAFYFLAAEKSYDLLSDVCALFRIRALEKARLNKEALDALSQAKKRHAGSPFFSNAWAWEAKLLGFNGRFLEAAGRYETLAENNPGLGSYTQYNFLAGLQFENAAKFDSALTAFRKVLDAKRIDRFTNRALSRHLALMEEKHHGKPPSRYRGYLAGMADAHFKESRFRQAQPCLEALEKINGGRLDPERLFQLGLSAFYNHDNKKAMEVLGALSKNTGGFASDAATYRLAKVQTRLGDNVKSRKTFRDVLKRFPKSGYCRAARYQLALLDMEDNKYKRSYSYFKKRLSKPSGNQKEYLTWLKAWTAYRAGHLTAAENAFSQLLSEFKRSRHRDRYLYWRSRVRGQRKNLSGATRDLKAVNANPRTYYGMLAAERLRELGKPARIPEESLGARSGGGASLPPLSPSLFPQSLRRPAKRCLVLSQLECLPEASRLAARMPIPPEDSSGELQLHSLRLLQRAGRYHQALRWAGDGENSFRSFCRGKNVPLFETYWSFIYPRAYRETVEYFAKKRDLSASLIYSIIYNESRVKPRAVSPSNAIGLMQIVPRTAHSIAEALDEKGFEEDALFDPETNIRFGTWYLKHMLNRFEGNTACAMAAYNAGPFVVGKWWRNKGDLPREVFVEEIPYKETNHYVKQVTRTQRIYQILYESGE